MLGVTFRYRLAALHFCVSRPSTCVVNQHHQLPLLKDRLILQIVARENKCFFLNITADLLRHKEYGKTEKVVAAIFSVAAKLWKFQRDEHKRPTIIFMDEIDNILGGKENSHEAYVAARSIFAQKWDGIQKTPGMIVMGTTNYPDQLPGFIYRRFLTRTRVRLLCNAAKLGDNNSTPLQRVVSSAHNSQIAVLWNTRKLSTNLAAYIFLRCADSTARPVQQARYSQEIHRVRWF
jgi:hypothetical protein